MKKLKLILCIIIIFGLIINFDIIDVNAFSIWEHYFGMDEKCKTVWYEGAECDGEPTTSADGWTAKLKSIGWGGVWGAQMKTTSIPYVINGEKYNLKCTLKSSNCDKWVFIKIATMENYAFGKWVRLKKGQATTIDETFTATANANQITFGFGGEFGDRESTDGSKHYSYADGGQDAIKQNTDVDSTYSTTLSCYNFTLNPASSKSFDAIELLKRPTIKKLKRTSNKAKLTLNKLQNAQGYQIKYSKSKNFKAKKTKTIITRSTTCTIKKIKKNIKYYVKARAYYNVSGERLFGSYSKIKIIPKK